MVSVVRRKGREKKAFEPTESRELRIPFLSATACSVVAKSRLVVDQPNSRVTREWLAGQDIPHEGARLQR